MSKVGQYIAPRNGQLLTLYSQPERNKEYIQFQWDYPVQAGPIIANWEAPFIGEWNEVQYMGKSYFIYENFNATYSTTRTKDVRHILSKWPMWSRQRGDWGASNDTSGERIADSLGLGEEYDKISGAGSLLKYGIFAIGGLVIYKALMGIVPKRRVRSKR